MEVNERVDGLSELGADRRDMPRCVVDEEATLLLVGHGGWVQCRVVELSVTGCRMSTTERLPAGVAHRVEAVFKVQGVSFRFIGVAEWTDGLNLVGIRFVEMPARRRDALAEVLCEVEAENAARREKPANAEQAADERVGEDDNPEELVPDERIADERTAEEWAAEVKIAEAQAAEKAAREQAEWLTELTAADEPKLRNENYAGAERRLPAQRQEELELVTLPAEDTTSPVKRERRMEPRHEVDTSAVILLINVGSLLRGRIVDLSLSGCRVRTEERFPVGIYTRVETEFRLEGLPFRLGGVIQAVHDRERHSVGIRFLDVSERKRAQVEQLIEEIEEMRGKKTQAQA